MGPTIYASFDDKQAAQAAINALIQSGVAADGVSLAWKSIANTSEDFTARGSEPATANEDDQEIGAMAGTFPDLRAAGPGNSTGDPSSGAMGTRFAGIAATANASTNPGGMTDFLWASLPVDFAKYYQQAYEGGKAIVIVRSQEPAVPEDAERVLREHGATQIQRQGYLA